MITNIILILLVIAVLYVYCLKRQLNSISAQLRDNRREGYDKKVSVALFDRSVNRLAGECNENLKFQSDLKRKLEHNQESMRVASSDIAHDLRTPLTVVAGNLQMLAESCNLTEKEMQYVLNCSSKTRELKRMVDDYFDIAMLESGDREIDMEPVDLGNLVCQVVLEHELLIREHKLTPDIRLPECNVVASANAVCMERVLVNLLGNIFRYGRDTFSIGVKADSGKCIIEVGNDMARGVKPDVNCMFHRNYKGDGARGTKGTGLGLYIVRLLVDKQSGKVDARIEGNRLVIRIELAEAV